LVNVFLIACVQIQGVIYGFSQGSFPTAIFIRGSRFNSSITSGSSGTFAGAWKFLGCRAA
jgi:hypothetical protein